MLQYDFDFKEIFNVSWNKAGDAQKEFQFYLAPAALVTEKEARFSIGVKTISSSAEFLFEDN